MPDYLRQEHRQFLSAADEAMQNPHLQSILTQLGDLTGPRNQQAWRELAGSDAIREKARAIKDATLAELDIHLQTLEASVMRSGGHVHWAETGDEAQQIIRGILQEGGAKRVVKSKSMTSEEIHLNTALEQAGVRVTESDLGEYIIQLAGHRPSHIVGPALHLSIQDVADILGKEAGHSLPLQKEELAAFARRRLRVEFAQADAGITGVNFAVAETGTIVLITNEGNGRLTTTLPRIHIALMGMEKVIPKLSDLGFFLKVLARASMGMKMSVYTSMTTGPRRPEEIDGPEEFHLVILDNGRSKILEGPLRESLFCIRCGACLNACPVYRTVGGHAYGGVYSGPIGAVLTPLYDGLTEHHHLPHASSLCGACQAACPVKIAIPDLLIKLREDLQEELHVKKDPTNRWESRAYRLWAKLLRQPWAYGLATWWATRTVGRFKRNSGWIGKLPGKLGGWTQTRDFPAPAPRRFRDWWRTEGRRTEGNGQEKTNGESNEE